MDSINQHEEPTVQSERSQPRRPRPSLEEYFRARYERLERIEAALGQREGSAENRRKLDLLRRAKFSTWLDLEALKGPERVA